MIERVSESHCGWMTVAHSARRTRFYTVFAVAVIVNLLMLTLFLVNKLFITNAECVHSEVRAEAEERVEQQAYNTVYGEVNSVKNTLYIYG